jgi:hypothetical protein
LPARDEKIALSARNLPDVRLQVLPGLSTLEVMNARQILVTRAALQKLTEIYAGSNGANGAPQPARTRAAAAPAPAPAAATAPAPETTAAPAAAPEAAAPETTAPPSGGEA